ncbi:hypothetical protein BGZ60DRAFT_431446 [Tricladium varicosporioides]|nr:hypothetical protein BGZ60DRAFT_431446 [Hymenoscyphus varicosporioides]
MFDSAVPIARQPSPIPPVSPTPFNSPTLVGFADDAELYDAGIIRLPASVVPLGRKELTFYPFSRLAPEIKDMIFVAALEPRVIHACEDVQPFNSPAMGPIFKSNYEVCGAERPDICKAIKAATEFVLRTSIYQPILRTSKSAIAYYFNPKLDSVRLDSNSMFSAIGPLQYFWRDLTFKFEAALIKNLELPLYAFERAPRWVSKNLKKLPNLKHVKITARDLIDSGRSVANGMFQLVLHFTVKHHLAIMPHGSSQPWISEVVPHYTVNDVEISGMSAMMGVFGDVQCALQRQRLMDLWGNLNSMRSKKSKRDLPSFTLFVLYAPAQTISSMDFPVYPTSIVNLGLGN